MSNDVVMVAIPKELAEHIAWCGEQGHGVSLNEARQLRAAPEVVSLEGVRMHDHGDAFYYKCQDIVDRILGPVQPSAVVSRDTVQVGFFEKTGNEDDEFELRHFYEGMNDVPERWVAAYADKKYWSDFLKEESYQKDQLPQPVAPVQSGDVELSGVKRFSLVEDSTWYNCLQESMDGEYIQFSEIQRIIEFCIHAIEESQPPETTPWGCVDAIKRKFDHLTTTQSAPSVGSVPTVPPMTWVFEIDEGEGDHDVDFVKKQDYDDLKALLTSRTEGKL